MGEGGGSEEGREGGGEVEGGSYFTYQAAMVTQCVDKHKLDMVTSLVLMKHQATIWLDNLTD